MLGVRPKVQVIRARVGFAFKHPPVLKALREQRGGRVCRLSWKPTTCSAYDHIAETDDDSVHVHFTLPYRVPFGVILKLVGSSARVGSWDIHEAPAFEWSEGHIWNLNIDLPPQEKFEYKVITYNTYDGTAQWEMPGRGNRSFELVSQDFLPKSVALRWSVPDATQITGVELTPEATEEESSENAKASSFADLPANGNAFLGFKHQQQQSTQDSVNEHPELDEDLKAVDSIKKGGLTLIEQLKLEELEDAAALKASASESASPVDIGGVEQVQILTTNPPDPPGDEVQALSTAGGEVLEEEELVEAIADAFAEIEAGIELGTTKPADLSKAIREAERKLPSVTQEADRKLPTTTPTEKQKNQPEFKSTATVDKDKDANKNRKGVGTFKSNKSRSTSHSSSAPTSTEGSRDSGIPPKSAKVEALENEDDDDSTQGGGGGGSRNQAEGQGQFEKQSGGVTTEEIVKEGKKVGFIRGASAKGVGQALTYAALGLGAAAVVAGVGMEVADIALASSVLVIGSSAVSSEEKRRKDRAAELVGSNVRAGVESGANFNVAHSGGGVFAFSVEAIQKNEEDVGRSFAEKMRKSSAPGMVALGLAKGSNKLIKASIAK